jgi:N-acyl homoserine lactone hydrolase
MDDIRLYLFTCGTLKCQVQNIKLNQGLGEELVIPVPWYVLTHPGGNVLIDGGVAAECAVDPKGHWPIIWQVYWPQMTAEDACVAQLEKHGIDPASIRYVIQSHLHLDHTGALAALDAFPNAGVLTTRAEYEYSRAPDWFADLGYIDADFIKPGVPWQLLETSEDGYDVFGDGVLRLWQTPGHSPGHQSFEVTLPNTGTVLLTVDAAYTTDHWNERALPGFLVSAQDAVRSVKKLHRIAQRSNALVVPGHDPEAWPRLRHAPEFYD